MTSRRASDLKPLLDGESLSSRGDESSPLRLGGSSSPLNAPPSNGADVSPITGKGIHSYTGKTIEGNSRPNTLVGGRGNQTIRGRGSNDQLWGDKTDGTQGGSDTFVFEKSRACNGMDTIKDYHWSEDGSDGKGQDVLDLTAALTAFKAALLSNPNADINDYVQLEEGTGGMKLMVDIDGTGGKSAEQWAFLEGLTAGDPVRVRAFKASCSGSGPDLGDGYYTIPDGPALPDYITVGREGMWFDTNEDGKLNGDETLLAVNSPVDGYYTINDDEFVGFDNLDYTVRFVDAKTPYPLDLTGFGAGDKLIIDGKTNCADWYGVQDEIASLANKVVPTYSPVLITPYSASNFDFGIYPGLKNASGYIYNTSSSSSPSQYTNGFYAYLSQRDSKVRGIASSYLANPSNITHPLAKGLPTSDPWPSYSIEVIKPSGGSLFAP